MEKFVSNLKLFWSKTNRFHRALFVLVIVELRILPSGKVGFQCKDPALSYPFTGDTISWKWLLSVCFLLPLAIMLVIERKYHNTDKDKPNKRALNWYKEYLFGYIINIVTIELLKMIVGAPRPHFFDTCMPKEATTCVESEYVSNYSCTKPQWQWQSDRSFPSGHTSMAIHASFFIVYYLHRRITQPSSVIIRCLQALTVAAGVWCALSRISDRRHHWWDVLAGTAIGFAVLFYTTHYLCQKFDCSIKNEATTESTENVPLGGTINT